MVAFVIQTSYLIGFYFSRKIFLQRTVVGGYFGTALTIADSETLTQDSKDIEWPITPELFPEDPKVSAQSRNRLCTVMHITI